MSEKPTYKELEQRIKELEQTESEHKQAEEVLRESEEKFRQMFETMNNGVAVYEAVDDGQDFIFTDFNAAGERIEDVKREAIIGKRITTVFPGVEEFGLLDVVKRVWQTGKAENHPISFYKDDRLTGWRENFVYKLPSGEVVAIYEDITKRKWAEEDLRHQSEMHKILMNVSSKYINVPLDDVEGAVNAALGEIGEFVSADRAYVFNYDFEKNIAVNTYEWCNEGIEPQIDNLQSSPLDAAPDWVESHLKGELVIIPDVSALPLGDLRDILEQQRIKSLITVPMFHEDRLVGFTGFDSVKYFHIYSGMEIELIKFYGQILVNLRMRIQSEEALRESEERFRTLFEKVPTPIQGYGPDETIHYWNKASENTYGYKKDEAIGKNIVELIIPPEMRGFVHDAIKQGAETGDIAPPGEHLLMRQDGSRVPVFSSHTVLKLGEKEPELYCLDVDMTVQKKLQERLQQVQKMEAISTLSGGIAHQFNNALTGITGNIDLLEMDFPDNETVANYTRTMKDSTRRMMQLTARLLAYARGGKFQAKTVSFSDFVRETLPLLKHALGSAIDVDTDLPLGILNVKADLTQMQMVLSAVLTNASEAMEGKGRIRVACRDTIITDGTVGNFPGLTPGNYVNLTIVDDGKGMDEETRTRIFEPFFTTKFQGRGLGMAATYGIVKNHDGWISVDSVLGQGTTVNIYLPTVEVPVKKHAKPKPKAEWIKGTGTILVIEDEEPVMKISRAILERLGYRVLEARTGQEAIDVVKTFDGQIDLALLDMLLPDMSGKDIYPLIMEARSDLKVIVFSGYSIDGPAREILNAGAEDFIQKPFMTADLSGKLKKILGGGQ